VAALDAAKVRVRRAEVTERLVGADFVVLALDDGTGPVWARLDLASGFGVSDYQVGDTVTMTGLLAPRPGEGDWWVRPRGPGDVERE
jgi:hypothetical protein